MSIPELCPRCGGFVILARESIDFYRIDEAKCLNCGWRPTVKDYTGDVIIEPIRVPKELYIE